MVTYRNLGKNIALQFLNKARFSGKHSDILKKVSKSKASEIAENNNRIILDMVMENWQIATSLKQKYGLGTYTQSGILNVYNYFNVIQFLMDNINKMGSLQQSEFTSLKASFRQCLNNENFYGIKEKDIIHILRDIIKIVKKSFDSNLREYGILD